MRAMNGLLMLTLLGTYAPSLHARPRATSIAEQRKLVLIQSVEAVRLSKPTLFWREGKQVPSEDVWILRVRVAHPLAFVPRDREGPTFMVGRSAALLLEGPAATGGIAILLAPALVPSDPAMVWMAPDVSMSSLSPKKIQRFLDADSVKARALLLSPPTPSATPLRYKDLGELLSAVRPDFKGGPKR